MSPLIRSILASALALPLTLAAQMSGTYTVDPAGGGNYTTIGAAVTALHTQGVSGPVTISIAPGAYPEQLILQSVVGITATNTVRFTSSTNNAADVTIGPGPVVGPTIDLTNSRGVTFQYVTILANDKGIIGSDPRHCHVLDCVLQGAPGVNAFMCIDLAKATKCSVIRNLITGSSHGLRLGDFSGAVISSIVEIRDNEIHTSCSAIDVRTVNNLIITSNYCEVEGDCSNDAIYVKNPSGLIRINKNKVLSYNGVALSVSDLTGSVDLRARIVNNMLINLKDADLQNAMVVFGAEYLDVFHNSMFVKHGFANVVQFYDISDVRFRGNALKVGEDGLVLFISGLTGPFSSNHNLFDSPTPYLFNDSYLGYSSTTWQALGRDLASLFVDPLFVSEEDLHLGPFSPAQNVVPDDMGVIDDIDNNVRSMPAGQNADIGCDERISGFLPPLAFAPPVEPRTELKAYPNPASDQLHIWPLPEENTSYTLHHTDGRLVVAGTFSTGRAIDVSQLVNGAYFLLVEGRTNPVHVVVQH